MTIFHTGDLQSGIATAIQQQKVVACFIRSDDPTSNAWEEEWLTDLQDVVSEKAVLLRLDFGSPEAGFLGAFSKIEKAPTLVIIQNGKVLEKLEGGVEREERTERLLAALGLGDEREEQQEQSEKKMDIGDDPATPDVAQAASSAASAIASAFTPQPSSDPAPSSSKPAPSTSQPAPSPSDPTSTPSTLFPDRASRLEADKATRDAAEKADRQARQEARRKEAEDAYTHHRGDKGKGKQPAAAAEEASEKQKSRNDWIYQQKQRKDEAKKERERILAQIEADKAERRARTERARQAEVEGGGGASEALPESRMAGQKRSAGASGMCALQVRLFDGSSVRGRFPVTATLAKDVREWVRREAPEGSGGADIPFTFRRILAPRPSRSIEISEEHQTLLDLDLIPNATLVLIPVAGSVDAYSAASSGWMGWGSSLASSAYGSLPNMSYYLPSVSRLYMGGTADEQEASNVQGAAMAGSDLDGTAGGAGAGAGSVRVKTLADQRAEAARKEKKTEFYNGNSLGFEGRKDDDDARKKD